MACRRRSRLAVAILLSASSVQAGALSKVQPLRGCCCTAQAPFGWFITGENAAGSSFEADFVRADDGVPAGCRVVGVPPAMRSNPC